MNVKTIKSEQVWQSSDGQRTIWEVTLKDMEGGKTYRLKTYSSKISQIGWSGEVRSYVNPRDERFVRQVPEVRPEGGGKFVPRDEAKITAQWAIGQAVGIIQADTTEADDDFYTRVEMSAKKIINILDKVKKEAENVTQ